MKSNISEIKGFLKKETVKKYAAVFAGILVLCLLLEVFVFNFKWINSVGSEKIDALPNIISGAEKSGGGIKITGDEAELEYDELNQKLKYLYIKPEGADGKTAEITVSANDEGNSSLMLKAPARTVTAGVPRSQYIRLHFSGEVSKLNIKIKGLNDTALSADDIILNTRVPLMFSWQRFLILALALMLLYVLRPGSGVYKIKTDMRDKKQLAAASVLLVVQAVCFFHMIHYNTAALGWHEKSEHHMQYYELLEAFKNGRLDVGDAPQLAELENPYDNKDRNSKRIPYKWDHAYYNGKYYVYFGALPALLLYLPYNLITGKNLPNYIAVYIFGVMVMLGILLLLWEIIKKWYKNTPFALYLLLSVVFGAASILGYAVFKPDMYLVPNMSAIMFGLFGLALWLAAEVKDENGETRLSTPRLALGSLCVALIAGCRPQLLLMIALGVMLFWKAVFKERALFSKKGIKPTLAVCLPFVIVAAAVMWYNFARFGSPFDFGASYNLTSNDMTVRGFVFGRIGLGLFSYLFQPINVDAVFPFLNDFDPATAYMGLTLTEKMIGGAFFLFPILLVGLYGAFKKNIFADRRAYRTVYFLMVITAVIVVLDSEVAGLLTRYFSDFIWLDFIASCITIFALYDAGSPQSRRRTLSIVLVLSVVTLAAVYLRIFAYSEDAVVKSNPVLYYTVRHLIAFWM